MGRGSVATIEPPSTIYAMPLLNPLNTPPVTLTFTRLLGVAPTTDDLGNPVLTQATAKVQAIVSPLSASRLADLAPIVGVDGAAIPVQVRVAAWPPGVGNGVAVASLTYNGRAATIRLAPIKPISAPAQRVAPGLGVSAEGVLVYG